MFSSVLSTLDFSEDVPAPVCFALPHCTTPTSSSFVRPFNQRPTKDVKKKQTLPLKFELHFNWKI